MFNWSKTGPIIEGGEETHANGAGQSGGRGNPTAPLIKRLRGGKKKPSLLNLAPGNFMEFVCNEPLSQLTYLSGVMSFELSVRCGGGWRGRFVVVYNPVYKLLNVHLCIAS